MKITVSRLPLTLSSLALLACTSTTATQKDYSGFLSDYSQLEKVKLANGNSAMRWVSPDLKKGSYRQVFMDPVVVYPAPQNSAQVNAKLVKDAAKYLEETTTQQLRAAGIEVVDAPEMGALRLRAAITTVETSAEDFKAYEIIPIAAIIAGISAAAGTRDRIVEAYMEAELTDISTGKVLVQVVKKGISPETVENDKAKVSMEQLKPTLDSWAQDAANFVHTSLH